MEDVFRELTTDILVEEHHVKILEERALKNGTLETVVGGRMARPVEKAFHVADVALDGGAEDVADTERDHLVAMAWCVTENLMQ